MGKKKLDTDFGAKYKEQLRQEQNNMPDGIQNGTITRGVESSNCYNISDWCANYHNYGVAQVSAEKRFRIGFYQISQSMQFAAAGTDQQYTSLAEAYLHFQMTLRALGCGIPPWARIEVPDSRKIDYSAVVMHAGQAIRMFIYRDSDTNRRSKFCMETLENCIVELMYICMSGIPRYMRKQCIFDGSENMCANLGKFNPNGPQ